MTTKENRMTNVKKTRKDKGPVRAKELRLNKETLKDLGPGKRDPLGGATASREGVIRCN
jgi:hypothetical protein